MRGDAVTRRDWIGATGLAAAAAMLPASARALADKAGHGPVRLSLNENALGPSPAVARAIAAEVPLAHRYVDQEQVDALVAQIAALEKVRPAQVILGEVLEPLGLALAAGKSGGGIVFSTPGYTALVDAAAPLGGRAVPVPLNTDLANDLSAIERAVVADTIAVSLVNPHNPSGTVDDPDALAGFIARVAPRTLVIVDEAYLEYDDLERRSAVRFVRDDANVVVFRTLAKIYGLAGLSIGYAVGPTALIGDLAKRGIGAPHALNRLSLAAAAAALRDQPQVARTRAFIASERSRLTQAIEQGGLRHTDSRANFVFFDGKGKATALRQAFENANIQIARPFPPLDSWLRITVGTAAENDAVIAVLRSARA